MGLVKSCHMESVNTASPVPPSPIRPNQIRQPSRPVLAFNALVRRRRGRAGPDMVRPGVRKCTEVLPVEALCAGWFGRWRAGLWPRGLAQDRKHMTIIIIPEQLQQL